MSFEEGAGEVAARERFGPYRLAQTLHSGRVASCYLAYDERCHPEVVVSLKVLLPFAEVKEQRDALLREAELQRRCRHSAIVEVLDAGHVEGRTFLARRYVIGHTWAELSTRGPLPEPVVTAVGQALLGALECIHTQKDPRGQSLDLVHRDVTPANVLVASDGAVFLTDFGLAHAVALSGALAEDEIAQGTPRYLPPEVARGQMPDARGDLFQLALSLAEALGGPLRSDTFSWQELPGEAIDRRVSGWGRSGPVLAKALSPEPGGRYASATEMRRAWAEAWDAPLPGAEIIAEWLSRPYA